MLPEIGTRGVGGQIGLSTDPQEEGRKEALPPETKARVYVRVCGERERASRANNRSEGKAER